MPHKFSIIQDYWEDDDFIFQKKSVTLRSGLTVLIGCNGSGKTTLLKQIQWRCDKQNIPCIKFDNLFQNHQNFISNRVFNQDFEAVAQSMSSSEGENINLRLTKFAADAGRFVRQHSDSKELFILLDGVDSGLSIDNVIELKQDLFTAVIKHCQQLGVEAYIIVSANAFEMAYEEQCLDVYRLRYCSVKTYARYKKLILQSRQYKDTRYKLLSS